VDQPACRTRLAQLLAGRHQTREEVVAAFDDRARQLREPATLSLRQLDRWLTGTVAGLPRPTACRVAESLWGEPISRLLGPPEPIPAAAPNSPATGVTPARLPGAPGEPLAADPDLVPHWYRLLGVLAVSENLFGPQRLTGTVMRELAVIRATRQAAHGPLRTAFVRIEARWAEFLSWLADNDSDEAAGQYWADRALEQSLETDDRGLVSYVLMRKSQQAVARGDGPRAVALATAAAREPAATPTVRALAAVRRAEGHALARDEAACHQAIDQARELVGDTEGTPADPWDSGLGGHCTPAYVRVHEAHCWLRLGQPARAVTIYEDTLTTWPSSYRQDEALHRSRLAQAYAATGEAAQAARQGARALVATEAGAAYRVRLELRQLEHQLAAATEPAALDFRRSLAGTSAEPTAPPLP
jgi:hypothetical protein